MKVVLFVLAVIIFAACKDLPLASFQVSTESAGIGDTIFFQSTSQNADTYEWDFRDGEHSKEKDPQHSFSSLGNYEVRLTASNKAGSDKAELMVHVIETHACWSQLARLLTPRQAHIAANVDNTIFVGGGIYSYYTFEAYDIPTDTWKSKADLPFAAEFAAGCALDRKVYFIGGWWENPTYDHLQVYDPGTNKWEMKAPMPTKRMAHAAVPLNGKIYVFGGVMDWPVIQFYTTIEIYDPATDSWESKTGQGNPGFTPRWGASACEANNKMYVMGGVDVTDYPPTGQHVPAMDIVEEYDPETNTWTRKTSMPTARWGLAAVAVDNKIYVLGGTNEYKPTEFRKLVEVYDPSTDTWETLGSMPKGLNAIPAVERDGIIYVPGGGGLDESSEYDCFYAYDPACDSESQH